MKTLALVALTLGCYGIDTGLTGSSAQAQTTAPPVTITQAFMSTGYNGKALGATSTFKSFTGKIHCTATMSRFATVTSASVWIAVDAAGKHNYAILQKSLPKQHGRSVHFVASFPRPWPVGKYRVDLFLNGKLVRSVPFTVTS